MVCASAEHRILRRRFHAGSRDLGGAVGPAGGLLPCATICQEAAARWFHWLGEAFAPAPAGYWGMIDQDEATRFVLTTGYQQPSLILAGRKSECRCALICDTILTGSA